MDENETTTTGETCHDLCFCGSKLYDELVGKRVEVEYGFSHPDNGTVRGTVVEHDSDFLIVETQPKTRCAIDKMTIRLIIYKVD